jgi:DNA-directed RNA polymerase beta subunit
MTAEEEDSKYIAQANASVDKEGNFTVEKIKTRFEGDFPMVDPSQASYMDVAANQIVSVAASLIPFLEHDDANRALMGSNMQRQGVPLLRPQAPIVGTGLERRVAMDSRALVVQKATAKSNSWMRRRSSLNTTVQMMTASLALSRTAFLMIWLNSVVPTRIPALTFNQWF